MSNRKTLREVCEMYRVTRRAIQGYEKAGLVLPSGKNKYGYLLYDEEAQRRIEPQNQEPAGFLVLVYVSAGT